ncbi:MAG: hypothetical protein HC896_13850 [Bacteroidales bacterium]|nr:hypothetical protein [Bacteroidales bacterium]
MGVTYKPVDALSVRLEPAYAFLNNIGQYVTTSTINNQTHYIFAEIDQKTYSATIRLEYYFGPGLTLQYYAMPFICGGKYSKFKNIDRPGAKNPHDRYALYTTYEALADAAHENMNILGTNIEHPDFNFKEYKSNMVLRWEYRPGSLLYLVWSSHKTHDGNYGTTALDSDLKNLYQAHAHNILLVKLSYRFGE